MYIEKVKYLVLVTVLLTNINCFIPKQGSRVQPLGTDQLYTYIINVQCVLAKLNTLITTPCKSV